MTSLTIQNKTLSVKHLLGQLEETGDDLSTLLVQDVSLQGSESDLLDVSKFFRGHQSLVSVTFRNVDTSGAETDLSQVISTLLIAAYKVRDLTLDHSDFSVSSLACLAYCNTLQTLQLPNNDLTDENAVAIADFLSQSTSIHSVDLQNNNLTDLGCHAIADAVKKSSGSIESVNVQGNGQISVEERTCLASNLNSAKAA